MRWEWLHRTGRGPSIRSRRSIADGGLFSRSYRHDRPCLSTGHSPTTVTDPTAASFRGAESLGAGQSHPEARSKIEVGDVVRWHGFC